MAKLFSELRQFFDSDGEPLDGGKIYFWETGGTSSAKSIYSDLGESVAISNPHVLDSEGRLQSNIYGSGAYSVEIKTSGDVLVDSEDPIGEISGAQFSTWNSLTTYNANSLVVGSDGNYYQSLVTSNQGNDPTTDATKWQQIEFIYYYNANRTYALYDIVRDANGFLYTSLQASNLNKTPASQPDWWRPIDKSTVTTVTSDDTLVAADLTFRRIIYVNTGAGAAVNLTLPAAAVGYKFACRVDAAQYLKCTANGTDTFSYGTETSAAGGYIRSNEVGTFWECECFVAGEWTITKLTDTLSYDQ